MCIEYDTTISLSLSFSLSLSLFNVAIDALEDDGPQAPNAPPSEEEAPDDIGGAADDGEADGPVVPGALSPGGGAADDIGGEEGLSLIHISEPTRLGMISYAVFCLKKKK